MHITRRNLLLLPALASARSLALAQTDLFAQGEAGVHTYRIPALAETRKGTLLAVCDARHDGTGDLPARISIVMRRSFDQGRTWTSAVTIRKVDAGGVGDPSLLADPVTGRVLCVFAYGPPGVGFFTPGSETLQVHAMWSSDEGATWSASRDLTPQLRDPSWKGVFATSGSNFRTSKGRYLLPLVVRDAKDVMTARNAYSDDQGVTWKVGPPIGASGDESHAVELADGTILQNIRAAKGNVRLQAWSRDGGVTFGEVRVEDSLVDPRCNVGICRDAKGVLYLTNAASTKRENLSIRSSRDGGHTWSKARVIHAGPAAYSSVVALRGGSIGVLYERGETHSVERITFARFRPDFLAS